MKYKNVLITGGSGFIGTHLLSELIKRNYSITVIDVVPPKVSGIRFIKGTFVDEKKIKPLLLTSDVVLHLAALVGVDKCRLYPDEVMKVNYKDSKKLIDMCVNSGVKRFIFSSSSEVYGNSPIVPYVETDTPTPVSVYGKTKVLIEDYLRTINNSNMSVGIARLFNVYGPIQRDSFVIPIFTKAAINNEPIKILGDGNQIRSFTYVLDAIEGIIKLMEYDKTQYEILNIGKNKEYTINETANIIIKSIPHSKSKIKYVKYGGKHRELSLEIMRRVPSTEKALKMLNFEAKTSLEEGVSHLIKSYARLES